MNRIQPNPPSGEGLPAPEYDATVVHVAAEYWPYARTGGLAEAVRGIARHQAAAGARTFAVMPLYQEVKDHFPGLEPRGETYPVTVGPRTEPARLYQNPEGGDNPRILFVEHDGYFGRQGLYGHGHGDYSDNHIRFGFFCRAVLDVLPRISPGPTTIHAHDWHAALSSVFLRTLLEGDPYYDQIACVLTVHNAGYQGHYGPEAMEDLGLDWSLFDHEHLEWYGKVNLLKGGLAFSDIVTTVSPTHARELRTRAGGFGLHDEFSGLQDRFVGILNGIDYDVWNPSDDDVIQSCFSADDLSGKAACKAWLQEALDLPADPDVPLFGMTARLAEQKGYDIILQTGMFEALDAQWVFLGEGEKRYEDALRLLSEEMAEKVAAVFEFSEEREHKLLAGADFLLMPSQYEPCGLTQMRAQRYGVLPVVRRVGGLADTVEDRVTGFVFDEYKPWALEEAVAYAADLYESRERWEELVHNAMAKDFSWRAGVARYQEVYQRAAEIRHATVSS
ncbi:MAG: glycogen/starch synthase [Gemmatimonadota bacterium]|jgi:starch synthase